MKALLQALLGDSLARILSGAGLSVMSYAMVVPLVLGGLNLAVSYFSGIGADIASLALMTGAGQGMSIIGSAIMARMAIAAAGVGIAKGAAS